MKPKLVSLDKPSVIPYSSVVLAAFHIPLWPFLSPSARIARMSKRSETYSIAKPAKPQVHGAGVYDVWHVSVKELKKAEKKPHTENWVRENWKMMWGSLMQWSICSLILRRDGWELVVFISKFIWIQFFELIFVFSPLNSRNLKWWEDKEMKLQKGSWVERSLCIVVFSQFCLSCAVPNEIEVEMKIW